MAELQSREGRVMIDSVTWATIHQHDRHTDSHIAMLQKQWPPLHLGGKNAQHQLNAAPRPYSGLQQSTTRATGTAFSNFNKHERKSKEKHKIR